MNKITFVNLIIDIFASLIAEIWIYTDNTDAFFVFKNSIFANKIYINSFSTIQGVFIIWTSRFSSFLELSMVITVLYLT